MRKGYFKFLLCGLFFFTCIVNAQIRTRPGTNFLRCASDDYVKQMLGQDLGYKQIKSQIEDQVRQFAVGFSQNKTAQVQLIVPVVFHVVWNTAAQNIADSYILAELTQLNKDYSKTNADTGSVPVVFKPLAINTDIQFCLAQRDPNGNTTTGITRTQTSVTSFVMSGDPVKHNSTGGHDIWDRTKYLNIWICNLSNGILGYATPPGASQAIDGVVVHYGSVGSSTMPNPYNWGAGVNYKWGRTATHEVGHWFNMIHIWGDDSNIDGICNDGAAGCAGTDQVTDTPNQCDCHYGNPAFPQVTCTNGPNGDMYMNYMDYVDDDAMYMFTAGQKTRMQAVFGIGGFRASLLTSNGCVPTGVNEISNLNTFAIYPNPSNGDVNIQLGFKQAEKFEITVLNTLGQKVFSINENYSLGGTYTLPLADKAKGIYFVKVATAEGVSVQKCTLK